MSRWCWTTPARPGSPSSWPRERAVTVPASPPPYPYDRLDGAWPGLPSGSPTGGLVDCSIGTPCDPPPDDVLDALASSGTERGYPASAGQPGAPPGRRGLVPGASGLEVVPTIGGRLCGHQGIRGHRPPSCCACGTPTGTPSCTRRCPTPPTPWGPTLAGCPGGTRPRAPGRGRSRPRGHRPVGRGPGPAALVNSPSNPTGGLSDLGRRGGVGAGPRRARVLRRVLCRVHLGRAAPHGARDRHRRAWWRSTRCPSAPTWPGVRVGFYAGDPDLVGFLRAVRRHAGLMVPGPAQSAGGGGAGRRPPRRPAAGALPGAPGLPGRCPRRCRPPGRPAGGGFYLWVPVPPTAGPDGWALCRPPGRHRRTPGQSRRALR